MGALCFFQCVLIVTILGIIIFNHLRSINFNKVSAQEVNRIVNEKLANEEQDLVGSEVQDAYNEAFEYFSNKMSGFEARIFDSNTYTSIILALITLCATLAVVIPYIVGRAITDIQIKNVAKKSYEEDLDKMTQDYSKRFRDLEDGIRKEEERQKDILNHLSWAEAHLSRMVSYLLNKKIGTDTEDKIETNVWAIGWASKALLRYIKLIDEKQTYYDQGQFVKQCIDFINSAAQDITNLKIQQEDKKDDVLGKLRRAFVDCMDSILRYQMNNIYIENVHQKKDILLKTLRDLYKKIYQLDGNPTLIIDAIGKKSKIKNDEKNNLTMPEFMQFINKWLTDNAICTEEWEPVA